jgi:nucleoside-diphosphate-sugar epimerase
MASRVVTVERKARGDSTRSPERAGRLLAGDFVVAAMTEARGASNAKARRELGWEPRHPSWRSGFTGVFAPR